MTETAEPNCVDLVWTPTSPNDSPFDRLFHPVRFGWDRFGFSPFAAARARFATDIIDHEDAYELLADVPGIPKDRIEVRVQGTELTIRASTESPATEPVPATPPVNYVLRERNGVSFERTFELPEAVPAGSIQAKVENGVLTVRVPKAKPIPEERIPIA